MSIERVNTIRTLPGLRDYGNSRSPLDKTSMPKIGLFDRILHQSPTTTADPTRTTSLSTATNAHNTTQTSHAATKRPTEATHSSAASKPTDRTDRPQHKTHKKHGKASHADEAAANAPAKTEEKSEPKQDGDKVELSREQPAEESTTKDTETEPKKADDAKDKDVSALLATLQQSPTKAEPTDETKSADAAGEQGQPVDGKLLDKAGPAPKAHDSHAHAQDGPPPADPQAKSSSGESNAKDAQPKDADKNADSLKAAPEAAKPVQSNEEQPASVASSTPSSFQTALNAANALHAKATDGTSNTAPAQQAAAPEQQFAADNADNIVTQVQTKLLPKGGSMQIRLDPPELGALTVSVKMLDGRMTAMFTAESDHAAELLGNNLNHLKTSLEATGVRVEQMQVRTSEPANNSSSSNSRDGGASSQQQNAGWQNQFSERQRREQLQRMWDKLAGREDLDLVA
ncbi:MAG: flagellar hook-length control protein FliK [Tepidisphaeraceae bacterium]